MRGPDVEVAQVIDAPPTAIYQVIADYRSGHPHILPKPYFTSLEVEEGGVGAGTVIFVTMSALGTKTAMRLHVTEPEPGRVLQEEDPEAGVVTTFTVTPVDGGARSRVAIATTWRRKPGIAGWLERQITFRVARRIYRQELDQLAAYMRTKDTPRS